MNKLTQYCILLLAVTLLVHSYVSVVAAGHGHTSGSNPNLEKINIIGEEHGNGIFDLSVEYGDDGVGWLVYSKITSPKYVETQLAKSTDHGKTWKYVRALNESIEELFTKDLKSFNGVWRYETPTLLYDPTDTPERRWKLFVQRYVSLPPYKNTNSLFGLGWIEYRYAKRPDKTWSNPERLFGKKKAACRVNLNSLDSKLRKFVFYNEIGSISVDGVIYLSMDASPTNNGLGKWMKRKIILISSDNHGKTWKYSGTLTDYKDASNLGYNVLTESSLVEESNRLFLLVSPAGAKGFWKKNRSHDGTFVIEIQDIASARLKRDSKGKLVIHKTFKPTLHSGGASDYHEMNTNGGILFCQIAPKSAPEIFQAFNTMEGINVVDDGPHE